MKLFFLLLLFLVNYPSYVASMDAGTIVASGVVGMALVCCYQGYRFHQEYRLHRAVQSRVHFAPYNASELGNDDFGQFLVNLSGAARAGIKQEIKEARIEFMIASLRQRFSGYHDPLKAANRSLTEILQQEDIDPAVTRSARRVKKALFAYRGR